MADDGILVDTNVLLTATTPARPLHRVALTVLDEWPQQGTPLWVSGQILREYLVVATRPPEVNGLGLEVETALANIAMLRSRLRLLDERVVIFEQLDRLLREVGCRGKRIHDANLVAMAVVHGATGILTANVSDFRRFSSYVEIKDLAEVGP